jgi:hypothetical protein
MILFRTFSGYGSRGKTSRGGVRALQLATPAVERLAVWTAGGSAQSMRRIPGGPNADQWAGNPKVFVGDS